MWVDFPNDLTYPRAGPKTNLSGSGLSIAGRHTPTLNPWQGDSDDSSEEDHSPGDLRQDQGSDHREAEIGADSFRCSMWEGFDHVAAPFVPSTRLPGLPDSSQPAAFTFTALPGCQSREDRRRDRRGAGQGSPADLQRGSA